MTNKSKTHLDNFTAACGLISSIAAQLGARIPPISKLDAGTVSKYEKAISKAIDDLKDGEPVMPGAQNLSTFDDLVDQEIARLGDDAKPRPPGNLAASLAIAKPSLHELGHAQPDTALIGLEKLVDIAIELGVNVAGQTPGEAVRSIHAALLKLKNPGDLGGDDGTPASKGDSLAEAMSHGRQAEAKLLEEVTRLRLIVQRIAGAMQVPSWDRDGTEIIEKAQRWDQARYAIKRRITELEPCSSGTDCPDAQHHQPNEAAAAELRYMLGLLASPRDVAKWLANKPKATVTSQVLDVLEKPTDLGTFKPLVPADVLTLARMTVAGERDGSDVGVIEATFSALARSVTASAEFCDLVNLIILPILARQNLPAH